MIKKLNKNLIIANVKLIYNSLGYATPAIAFCESPISFNNASKDIMYDKLSTKLIYQRSSELLKSIYPIKNFTLGGIFELDYFFKLKIKHTDLHQRIIELLNASGLILMTGSTAYVSAKPLNKNCFSDGFIVGKLEKKLIY